MRKVELLSKYKMMKKQNNNGGESTGIIVLENHIYFYTDVTIESCLELNVILHEMRLAKYKNIFLHINSYGGDLIGAFAVVGTIRRSNIPITSIVEGYAASAATLISSACHRRWMLDNSFMLIHEMRSGREYLAHSKVEERLQNDRKYMETLVDHYQKYTKLDRKTLVEMLKTDVDLSAEECVKLGLVDKIAGKINGRKK